MFKVGAEKTAEDMSEKMEQVLNKGAEQALSPEVKTALERMRRLLDGEDVEDEDNETE